MKNTVTVSGEQRISATPDAVWQMVADPAQQSRLEPRCHLASVVGDWRAAGSEFVLVVRGHQMRYVVAEAEPGVRWVANVDRRGRQVAIQHGELTEVDGGTLLRWTVTIPAGFLTRRLVQKSCERELPRWLAAVAREVVAHAR